MPKKAEETGQEGRYAYDGLDRVMHEKGRLAIMTSLMTHPRGLLFGELKRLTSMTDGNLNRHIEVLREAELVEMWKGFEGRRPQTLIRLTREGRERFVGYLGELERVIQDAKVKQSASAKAASERELPPGWVPV